MRTVARYETEKPPTGDALLSLAKLAGDSGRSDLAIVFQSAYAKAVPSLRNPVAEAIRRFRIMFGDTQQQFAVRTGLSVATIARYETNSRPSPEALKRLSDLAENSNLPRYSAIFRGDEAAAAGQSQQEGVVLVRLLELKVDKLKAAIVASRLDALRSARLAHAILSTPQSALSELETLLADQLQKTDDIVAKTCSANDLMAASKQASAKGDKPLARSLAERAHKLATAVPPKERLQ